jgi:hypothetical protein
VDEKKIPSKITSHFCFFPSFSEEGKINILLCVLLAVHDVCPPFSFTSFPFQHSLIQRDISRLEINRHLKEGKFG